MLHFHSVWMLMKEEHTSKTRKQSILYREQSSGHWLNSIPEGNKLINTELIFRPNICVFAVRDLHLPDDSWTNDFERLFSLKRDASPLLPSTEVLLHEP